jgi:hypothetical protein
MPANRKGFCRAAEGVGGCHLALYLIRNHVVAAKPRVLKHGIGNAHEDQSLCARENGRRDAL